MTDAIDCDCCLTPAAMVAARVENRAGLSAIAYRIGSFATFRQAIVDELSQTPELAKLTTRLSEDYTITAIELWAAVADVLSFYQERFANEAFLRTATLRDSLLRLVRLIGYELAPGAAATARLAFTLEAGATALIPVGTRVQSVPNEGEKPQTYETLAPLAGNGRLNRLRLFPHPLASAPTSSGQASAIVAPDPPALAAVAGLAPGDRLILFAPDATETLTVRELSARDDLLTLTWSTPIAGGEFTSAFDGSNPACQVRRLGRAFHLFGHDAPPVVVVPAQTDPSDATTTYITQALTDYTLHGDQTTAVQISLDSRQTGLQPGGLLLAVAATATATATAITTTAIPFHIDQVAERKVQRSAKIVQPMRRATVNTVVSQTGTVSQLTLSSLVSGKSLADLLPDSGDGNDIRNVVVYELLGPPLRFWPHSYPSALASEDACLPGRRVGWSAVEVGRTIEKGGYKPGTVVDLTDFTPGRAVLLTDAAGDGPVAATLVGASLLGTAVSLGPTEADTLTIRLLGLAADQATPLTVVFSAALGNTLTLPSGPRELSLTLGDLPPQTIALDATLSGEAPRTQVAAALQTAIRNALPGAPSFAQALVWEVGESIAVAAGLPADRISLGPSLRDQATIAALGLDGASLRYADGWLSVPLGTDALNRPPGQVRVTLGIADPQDLPVSLDLSQGAVSAAKALETLLDHQSGQEGVVHFRASADGRRLLVLPRLPAGEPRSFVRLALKADRPFTLASASAVLLGNVAPASHGETVRAEILGDGDAAQAFQRFTLRKKPLTFVPGATPGGVTSTLAVAVNGVTWAEVSTLYGTQPRDEVYLTRRADDGTVSVQFGDGVHGARPASGRQNVVARYRYGIGLAGRVGAGSLTTLLDRPTGVKNVSNLLAADGGADPQTLAKARRAAPGTVRTFGRAVSLRDFEDTALLAGEVAKAIANWVWAGDRRAIHLTVAAQGGNRFSPEGLARLAATLASARDPNQRLLIANHLPVAVRIAASLQVDGRHETAAVLATARSALLDALSFERRHLAEPVFLSDLYRVLQEVDGVLSVDIDSLDLKSSDAGFRAAHGLDDTLPQPQPRLLMLPARPGGAVGQLLAAELAVVESPAQDVLLTASGGIGA